MKAIVIALCFWHVASARLLFGKSNSDQAISPVPKRPESVCRLTAYASAVACTINGSVTDTLDKELECMADVVEKYLNCTGILLPELPGNTRRTLIPGLAATFASKIALSEIRCILDNILDLIKCVIDGELVDAVPFKWNWGALVKCGVSNLPKYFVCFRPVLGF